MNNIDHSEVKLLNKHKVTERDLAEFNSYLRGESIEPKLSKEFNDLDSYESFMLEYDPTVKTGGIPLNEPGLYGNGSDEYEYLSGVNEAEYDQLVTDLASNGLKIEYDNFNDEFKVYSSKPNHSKVGDAYDEPMRPGEYYSDSPEYEFLSKMDDENYQEYLDELARWGTSVTYDTVEDKFVVTCSMKFSAGLSSDLEENSYEVVEVRPVNSESDSYYLDMISECHPWYNKIYKLIPGKSVMIESYKVTKLSDDLSIDEAYNFLKETSKIRKDEESSDTFSRGDHGSNHNEDEYVIVDDDEDGWTAVSLSNLGDDAKSYIQKYGFYDSKGRKKLPIDGFYMTKEVANARVKELRNESRLRRYSDNQEREKVSATDLKKAQEEGVVQKKPNGKWGIISIDSEEWWIPDYDTKESAENALKAYHANK